MNFCMRERTGGFQHGSYALLALRDTVHGLDYTNTIPRGRESALSALLLIHGRSVTSDDQLYSPVIVEEDGLHIVTRCFLRFCL